MTKRNPWLRVGLDAWSLGLEASSVIALRALRISAGGRRAKAEASRMIGEKVQAAWALQAVALSGGLGLTAPSAAAKAISHYRQRVRANRRRLAK
jgi:hypothetical protein